MDLFNISHITAACFVLRSIIGAIQQFLIVREKKTDHLKN